MEAVKPSRNKAFLRVLAERLGPSACTDRVSRGLYATDASLYQVMPLAVVTPRNKEEAVLAVRIAAEHGVPITPRGGGTSLGGQAVGEGLVLDCSRHMHRVLEVNPAERWVRVEPGIVRDVLNAELAPSGLHFAPDPATGSRACIGGMIGNNSSGMRSLRYGMTVHHVEEVVLLLSTGETVRFHPLSPGEYDRAAAAGGAEGRILSGFKEIMEARRGAIVRAYPRVPRRVMGYNLDAFPAGKGWNLSHLVTGSEGTLGVLLEARLRLEPVPAWTGLCLPHFQDLEEALSAVAPVLEHGPSAVEIMDATLLRLARSSPSAAAECGFIEGDPAAVLVVEFTGETEAEVRGRLEALAADLGRRSLGYARLLAVDRDAQARVWAVRRKGLGLLSRLEGARKPVAFIEDAALPVEHVSRYVKEVLALCRAHGTDAVIYAHVGGGLVHVRPALDLHDPADVGRMKELAEAVFHKVREYGGAFSGEHGDGRVRSPFLERYFGDEVYGAFRAVKALFDPAGLMNPGVIVDPAPMDRDLRYGEGRRVPEEPGEFSYPGQGGLAAEIERCTGVGDCRQLLSGTMCPTFRATREEAYSTRGRANALRLAASGVLGPGVSFAREVAEVLEHCLACKACKAECPSGVDLARLKSEFLQKYYDRHGVGLRARLVAASPRLAALFSGRAAPLVNRVQRTRAFRLLQEKMLGFHRARILPSYAAEPFSAWVRRQEDRFPDPEVPPDRGEAHRVVVLFADTFMNFHEPHVGIVAVELLESCGFRVIPARAGCCQRPRISQGFLRAARRDGEVTLRNLDAFIRRGLDIVVCEPGCASALLDDLPDLVGDGALAERIRAHVFMIDVFLARELRAGRLSGPLTSPYRRLLVHGHCHRQALFTPAGMEELYRSVEGVTVDWTEGGCCGMAGAFGYEKEHYELSLRVGEEKLFPAIRARPEGAAVVASGFSCRRQITHAAGVEAVHFVETVRGKGRGARPLC